MVILKTKSEIEEMKKAGQIVAAFINQSLV